MADKSPLSGLVAAASLNAAWHAPEAANALLHFEGRTFSHREIEGRVRDCAARLQRGLLGAPVQRGDRVMLMLDNGPHFIVTFLACQRLAAVPVPVSPRSSAERIARIAADCGAVTVLHAADLSPRLLAMHAGMPHASRLVALPLDLPCDASLPLTLPAPADRIELAFIQYTSGSTGDAKGVMISHAAVLANIAAFCGALEVSPRDRFSSLLPLFHDMGLVCFGLAPLLLGLPLVLYRADALSLRAWLQGVSEHGVTLTGAPDTLLQLALRVIDPSEPMDLSSLRVLICGSEPVRADTVQRFGQRFGVSHAIKPAYGMAELTLCATMTRPGEAMRIDPVGHVASGRAIDGVALRVQPDEGDSTGQGEILVRSPSAMSGYWGRPEATREAFDEAGWLRTGDTGYVDAEGCLYILGRRKNMLIRGGEKHSPHDLETAAQSHAEVRRAAVVQTQDDGARIVCVMEVDRLLGQRPAALKELAARVRRSVQTQCGLSPDVCCFVSAGTLPVTENGKMQHARLRTALTEGRVRPLWTDAVEPADVAALA